ncbi:hypothetical protein KAFR_0F02870 [Kazachstania africana CBS 2517]|uniref:Protein YTP1-like C-terminal domain-containing protein n=1 Tax=Kazachstania africana (strain ATCC 22294 / BCRC 22015 / CBS 2517 / CECT 1963 / NBRC 1671 / NRRL Y-8276) TaxID=1071382 RepID=H2AWY3_KAZAF|nr:hypothetical protein KAFR_0F02870 [Kazachstania africana CBS 2517]CCF58883.1 hypothetical protein KAFR_0F02870 [Kazachstania africana CBS 2517]
MILLVAFWFVNKIIAMDMPHHELAHTGSSALSISTITPIPHEPMHMHDLPILEHPDLSPGERLYWENYSTTTYFTTSMGNRFAFNYHVTTIGLILLFLYPISLVLYDVSPQWYFPFLTLNLLVTLSSLLALSVFAISFPEDWYPNNIHGKTSYILFFLILLHYVSYVISRLSAFIKEENDNSENNDNSKFHFDFDTCDIPLQNFNEYENIDIPFEGPQGQQSRYSKPPELGSIDDLENRAEPDHNNDDYNGGRSPLLPHFLLHNKGVRTSRFRKMFLKMGEASTIVFQIINVPLLLYLFTYTCIGLAVGNLLGQGARVFNLLAHWIKGGVFLFLGVLALSRYCGLGSKYGWAWNRITLTYQNLRTINRESRTVFPKLFLKLTPKGTITMEGFESFLIFFYGTTNVFLEHLAGAGGAWTAKDLQHVSIAFVYIGTGLCGLLTEIRLNKWRYERAIQHEDKIPAEEIYAASPGFSPNPFPTLTIFWTGILMSQHAQNSETSTMIHMQWGYLLSYGSLFRLLTFIILFLVPNHDTFPSKPFTELITSFCLICGGLVFMESTDQVIEGLEYRGFTPMFTFNIIVGLSGILMGWIMILYFCKDYLKEKKRSWAD